MANVYNCGPSWCGLSQHCFCCHHGCGWVPPWRLTAFLMGLFPLPWCNLEAKLCGGDHMSQTNVAYARRLQHPIKMPWKPFWGQNLNVKPLIWIKRHVNTSSLQKRHWWNHQLTALVLVMWSTSQSELCFQSWHFLVKLKILASIPSKNP